MVRLTGQTVEERSDAVVGFAGSEDAAIRAADGLRRHFAGGVSAEVRPIADLDWTVRWQEGLEVRQVGRLRLGPSWLLEPGPTDLVVDPEMAFGSGEHGSTRGALTLLDRHLKPGGTVLDLGSGSGILAIAAVKLGAERALGIEIDDEAIPVAEGNARRNQVAERTHFVVGDAAILAPLAGPAALVVSNILRTVNETLLEPIARSLAPGGVAIYAGMEESEAAMFRPLLSAAGWRPFDEIVDAGWWAVAARRDGADR
ncbi:MAG: 50S ribosomal protein L11 methyltransferase [Gemmatimonadetes bacterium]|nr:50S ribosomal protein L11 methyltransferase [Gemmatimonadota bacterium]